MGRGAKSSVKHRGINKDANRTSAQSDKVETKVVAHDRESGVESSTPAPKESDAPKTVHRAGPLRITVSNDLIAVAKELGQHGFIDKDLKRKIEIAETISVDDVRSLWSKLNKAKAEGVSCNVPPLSQVLKGNVSFNKKEIPQRSAALKQRLEKFKAMEDEREYRKMVSSVETYQAPSGMKLKQEMESANNGVSILFGAISAFVVAYYGSAAAWDETAPRLILALFVAIVILMAEMWLFVIRSSRAEAVNEDDIHASPHLIR